MGDITKHFSWSEFASKDGADFPDDVAHRIENELAPALEVIRKVVGKPLRINSGYRSPEHNAKVGGSKRSQHVKGRAVDLALPEGMGVDEFAMLIGNCMALGMIPEGGLGRYRSWVHYDTRGKRARWDNR